LCSLLASIKPKPDDAPVMRTVFVMSLHPSHHRGGE
jgi:hypothetical protein